MVRKFFALTAAVLLAASATAAGAATVVTLSNVTVANQFLDLDLGINFTVNSNITVSSLGAFTNGSSPIAVTLYQLSSTSTGTALSSALITGTPVSGSNYSFSAIAPVTLTPGLYQINARYTDTGNGNYNPNSGNTATVLFNTLAGKLSFSGSYYNYPGSGTVASTIDGVSQLSYGAGTFGVVPEPATWGLLVVGFGLVGVSARRRNGAVAA